MAQTTEEKVEKTTGKRKKPEYLRRTFKSVIRVDENTAAQLWYMSKIMVHLWNMAIDQAEKWLDEGKDLPPEQRKNVSSAYTFNYWLTEARNKLVTLEDSTAVQLSTISSDCQREVLRKLAGSYKSFFELKRSDDKRARTPWKKKEEWFQTLSWSSFSLCKKEGSVRVAGFGGQRIELHLSPYLREEIAGRTVAHVTVSYDRSKKAFELSLVTNSPLPTCFEHPNFFRAIDLGAGDIAVTDSDGSEFLIPTRRPDKFTRGKIAAIEKRAERRTKGSRGYEKLMTARRKLHKKGENQRTDHQRKIADALTEDGVQCIVLGKPKTRLGLARSEKGGAKQHAGVQNTGFMFRLLQFIKDKAAEKGIVVVELPDPPRQGDLRDPTNKFDASRALLTGGMKKLTSEVPIPEQFTLKHFRFSQGKGQPSQGKS